jgi:spermidine synthase
MAIESEVKPATEAKTVNVAKAQVSTKRRWLWQPNLIVFISSGAIMILELVAGRIIAPHVGSSLYTWTGVIGVVLAGISLGNYLGGRLADRWASLRFLGLVYIIAALSCLIVLWLDHTYRITPSDWSIVVEIVVLTAAMFFVPCTVLGMISPIVAKLAVSDLARTGSTVGNIYAAGALGSIVGTFATGFVLISWFGTYAIVLGVALFLFAIGLLFILAGRWQALLLSVLVIAGGAALFRNQGWLMSPCVVESNYYCIKVYDEDHDGEPVRLLVLDHLVHSYVSLGDPNRLVYDYEKMYAEAAAYKASQNDHLSALMIGGGGYTFPRYMESTYPNSTVHVVEIDPAVTQNAYDRLLLDRAAKITTFNEDARTFMARPPTMKYDLVLGDAFNHFSVPYHLTTKEFNDRVHAWLAPDGLYVVNIIDGPYGEFIRAYVATMRLTFRNVYLALGSRGWRTTARTTFVVIGTDTPLDLDALKNYDAGDGDALLSRLLASDAEMNELLNEAPQVILTDQFAPVDQMLASVFREEVPK